MCGASSRMASDRSEAEYFDFLLPRFARYIFAKMMSITQPTFFSNVGTLKLDKLRNFGFFIIGFIVRIIRKRGRFGVDLSQNERRKRFYVYKGKVINGWSFIVMILLVRSEAEPFFLMRCDILAPLSVQLRPRETRFSGRNFRWWWYENVCLYRDFKTLVFTLCIVREIACQTFLTCGLLFPSFTLCNQRCPKKYDKNCSTPNCQ